MNTKWKGLTIRDKVGGERVIPFKRRPLDLLRLHHERTEAWMLE